MWSDYLDALRRLLVLSGQRFDRLCIVLSSGQALYECLLDSNQFWIVTPVS